MFTRIFRLKSRFPSYNIGNLLRQQQSLSGPAIKNDSELSVPDALATDGKGSELSTVEEHRIDMAPFAKNLFLGVFDTKVLSYPDILDNDRYYALEKRCHNVRAHLASKEELIKLIDKEEKISKDIMLPLRSLGLYGLRGKESEGGQGLCFTEALKVLEELSCSLSLSEAVTGPNTYGYMAIEKCGTKSQKAKYLPKLLSGESIGAICMADDQCGTDISSTGTVALYDEYEGIYYLSGKKTWVSNGTVADVFTVFANVRVKDPTGVPRPQLTAFIVDKSMPGVTIGRSENKIGMKGLETCEVAFNKTPVPEANLLGTPGRGTDVYAEMMITDRVFAGARVSSLLRELFNNTIKHVTARKAFDRTLSEFDLVKHRITNMTLMIYTLESMTYMTAGLADVQKNVDIVLEAAMTKLYAIKASKMVVENCLTLLGGRAYLETEPFNQVARDLQALELWEGSADLLHMTVALAGMAHAGEVKAEAVRHWRNPITYPVKVIRKMWALSMMKTDWFLTFPLKLGDSVHPSLSTAANIVEYCVLKLQYGVDMAFIHHGNDIGLKEVDLYRLSVAATETYAMVSALARANRSYCQGHAHGELEIDLALAAAFEGKKVVAEQVDLVAKGFYSNNDFFTRKIAEYAFDNGKYSAEHPITRNIF